MSHEAEQSVLGAILIDPKAWHRVAAMIDAHDFADTTHRELWQVMQEMVAADASIDIFTFAEWAQRAGRNVDGGYIVELAGNTPGSANAEGYAEIVRDHAIRRRVQAAGRRLANMELVGELAIAEAQRLIGKAGAKVRAQSVNMGEALKAVYRRMEERFGGVQLPVTPTPWRGVNGMLGGGLGDGKLYIVAGRPGMGKTAWMRGFAVSAAERGHVAIVSLEMDREEVAGMMLAGSARVSYQHIRDPREMPDDDWSLIAAGMVKLQQLPISICDVPALSLPAITAEVMRLHSRKRLSAVLIDYLGLIDLPDADRQDLAIGEVTRGLKRLARDLGAPVVLLCQLSRKVEERSDKRPMLSDLRDAGQIEQDADGIILLYRDAYYRQPSPFGDVAEMNIAKQRGGRTGVVPVVFRAEQIEFADYDGEWPMRVEEPRKGPRGFGRIA